MKKIFFIILILSMLFLVGCDKKEVEKDNQNS